MKISTLVLQVTSLLIMLMIFRNSYADNINREKSILEYASSTLIMSLSAIKSKHYKPAFGACESCQLQSNEVQLVIIALGSSPESREALINLFAYKLDGEGADLRNYYFRKNSLYKDLKKMSPENLYKSCENQFLDSEESVNDFFPDISINDICYSLNDIQKQLLYLRDNS